MSTIPTTTTTLNTLNESNINQAISFLKDSRVINTSINKKIEFLKNKKLSITEIAESFKRAYPNSNEWKDILAGNIPNSTSSTFSPTNNSSSSTTNLPISRLSSYDIPQSVIPAGSNPQIIVIPSPYPPPQPIVNAPALKENNWSDWFSKTLPTVFGNAIALGGLAYIGKNYVDTSHYKLIESLNQNQCERDARHYNNEKVNTSQSTNEVSFLNNNIEKEQLNSDINLNLSTELNGVRSELGTLSSLMRFQAAELKAAIDSFKDSNNSLITLLKQDKNMESDKLTEIKSEILNFKSLLNISGYNSINNGIDIEKKVDQSIEILKSSPREIALAAEAFVEKNLSELMNTADYNSSDRNDELMFVLTTLCLYLKNVVDHPEIPAYRKLVLSNQRFKRCREKFPLCESVLIAAGFELKGSFLELPSFEDKESYTIDLLRYTIKSIENVKSDLSNKIKTNTNNDLKNAQNNDPSNAAVASLSEASNTTILSTSSDLVTSNS